MDNQGELHKYFVIVFEKEWNANLFKCVIQEQLWALFKLRNVYFVLSKLQLNCYKRLRCATHIYMHFIYIHLQFIYHSKYALSYAITHSKLKSCISQIFLYFFFLDE